MYYFYDSINQLIREDNEELNQTIFYQYDSNGNIQLKEIYEYSLSNNLENKRIKEYNYNDFNDYLTGYSDKEIRIDELGRTCMYGKTILHWNQSELKQYGEVEFCYNENHIRTKKSKNGKTIEYIVDGSRILKEKRKEYSTHLENRIDEFSTIDISEEELEYIYTPVGIIGFDYIKENIKRRYYYNKNILGDILEIYDEEGQLVGKYIYDAYGNHQVINYTQDNIGDINPFRYRGYYYDTETGWFWLSSRYYSPELCRFISPDSVEYLEPESINGLNLYAYAKNNPIMYYDLVIQQFW